MVKTGERTPNLDESLATESRPGATTRNEFAKRLNRYSNAKQRTLSMSEYINTQQPKNKPLARTLRDCGGVLIFRDYYLKNELRLANACFCKKHLLCVLCAVRRGAKMVSRYLERFEVKTAENPNLRPYMVTLTVKDGEDLSERFDHLQKSVRLMHKYRHGKRHVAQVKKADSACWSYEVKRGKNSGLWHPHVHAVWLCEVAPDQVALSKEWERITGDSKIVDVREISPKDPVKGFLEVFKYAVKFSDQPEEDTWHCYESLSGRRLIGSFGGFYGIPEPDELTDDPLEGEPFIERMFSFSEKFGLYKEKPVNPD